MSADAQKRTRQKMRDIEEHVRMCPLGWYDGAVRTARRTTDADIIEWLFKLRQLVGLESTPEMGAEGKL